MRINFLLPGIGVGGGARVVFEYANRLSKRGHDVTVLYPAVPSRMVERGLSPKARTTQIFGTIKRLTNNNGINWFDLRASIKRIPTLSPHVASQFKRFVPDADVTIATAWQTAYTVAALDESKGEKAYFVQHYEIWDTWNSDEAWKQVSSITEDPRLYPVEMYEVTPSEDRTRREKALVDRSYELPLAKITISSWLSELIHTKFDQDVVDVIANSVNHSTFYPDPTIKSDSLSLLLPYRNSLWKGQREARQLINKLSFDEVHIHTYGSREGSELPQNVNNHPNVSDTELRHLYSNADIFVLPSWTEGFGLPPLEAMACKCAVVTTNVGAVPDYAEDGENALVVPPRDSSALIDAVYKLIEDEKKRDHLSEQGYKSVMNYTWNDATTQFECALQTIVENNQ